MQYFNESSNASPAGTESSSLFSSMTSLNFQSMWAITKSYPVLASWVQIVILGGLLDYLRQLLSAAWNWLVQRFVITADFEQNDEAFGKSGRAYFALYGLSQMCALNVFCRMGDDMAF